MGPWKSGQNLLPMRVLTSISQLSNPVLDPFLQGIATCSVVLCAALDCQLLSSCLYVFSIEWMISFCLDLCALLK